MPQAKFAHIYTLNQSLKKDKLDQMLKINHQPLHFITRQLIEKDDQGKSYFKSRTIITKNEHYLCWILDFFQSNHLKQHFVVIFSEKKKIDSAVFTQLDINPSKSLVARLCTLIQNDKTEIILEGKNFLVSTFRNIKDKFTKDNGTLRIEHKPEIVEKKDIKPQEKITDEYQFIQKFLNSSQKLTSNDFTLLDENNSIRIESGSLAMIQKNINFDFEKITLLFTLAYSYQKALKKGVYSLSRLSLNDNLSQLKEARQDSIDFMIQSYFDYPVALNQHQLILVWKNISTELHLHQLEEEFLGKIDLAKKAIEAKQKAQKEKEEKEQMEGELAAGEESALHLKKINSRVTFFGILLLITALLSVTPFSLSYFFYNWSDLIQPLLQTINF